MQLTGYKEVWIGISPPTGSRRQSRDRRILVDDLWLDTGNKILKRCTAINPPTWEAVDLSWMGILTSPNGTKFRIGINDDGSFGAVAA